MGAVAHAEHKLHPGLGGGGGRLGDAATQGPAQYLCAGSDCGSGVSVPLQELFLGEVTPRGLLLLGKMLSVHLLLSPYSSQYFHCVINLR